MSGGDDGHPVRGAPVGGYRHCVPGPRAAAPLASLARCGCWRASSACNLLCDYGGVVLPSLSCVRLELGPARSRLPQRVRSPCSAASRSRDRIRNLQRGLDRLVHQLSATTDLWVLPPGTQNLLATTPFQNTEASKLGRLPGVQAVGLYRAGFLDYGDRRIWVLAPPSSARNPIPPSQLVTGSLTLATARLRLGGWAVVSQAIANQHHLHIGQRFTLPSPYPRTFRVAALTHESRLATRRDHPQLRGLCASLG